MSTGCKDRECAWTLRFCLEAQARWSNKRVCVCVFVCARARVCNGCESRNGHRNTRERGAHSEIENPVLSRHYEEKVKVYCKKKRNERVLYSLHPWLAFSLPPTFGKFHVVICWDEIGPVNQWGFIFFLEEKGVKDARFSSLLSVSASFPSLLSLLFLLPFILESDSDSLPRFFVPLVLCLLSLCPPRVIFVSFRPFCLLNWFDVWPPSNCPGTVGRTRW